MSGEELRALTARELEIVKLIAAGYNCREIASALAISYYTARKHRANIQSKLQFGSASKLAATAVSLDERSPARDRPSKCAGPP